MSHYTDAEGSITTARAGLASIQGAYNSSDITTANANRAQAIATIGVTQALLALTDALTRQQTTQTTGPDLLRETANEINSLGGNHELGPGWGDAADRLRAKARRLEGGPTP